MGAWRATTAAALIGLIALAGPAMAHGRHHHHHPRHHHAKIVARTAKAGRHGAEHAGRARHRRHLAKNEARGGSEKVAARRHAALCDTVFVHHRWRTSCRGESES